MPIANELLNEIETELFAETGSSEMESSKVCEKCGNQPCTCHKSDKTCPTCGKSPCQCKETKSNNSTQDTTMPLFDDPELNQLFDEHAPGEGAESGKEAKDPNPDTVGDQAEAELAKRKKCKSIEEELFDDKTEGVDNADATIDGDETEEAKRKKGGKKHKSDIADLFSDDLFKEKGEGDEDGDETDDAPAGDDEEDDDDEEIAEESALLISEAEAALDFDL